MNNDALEKSNAVVGARQNAKLGVDGGGTGSNDAIGEQGVVFPSERRHIVKRFDFLILDTSLGIEKKSEHGRTTDF